MLGGVHRARRSADPIEPAQQPVQREQQHAAEQNPGQPAQDLGDELHERGEAAEIRAAPCPLRLLVQRFDQSLRLELLELRLLEHLLDLLLRLAAGASRACRSASGWLRRRSAELAERAACADVLRRGGPGMASSSCDPERQARPPPWLRAGSRRLLVLALVGALRDAAQLHFEIPALERRAAIQVQREAARDVQRLDQRDRDQIQRGDQILRARSVGVP